MDNSIELFFVELIMQRFKEFFLVTIGTFIMAVGFNSLFLANNIASGGISGLAISINKLFEINPATFIFIVNIPLLIACYVFLGRTTFLKTVYGSNIYPFFLKLTDSLPTLTKDPLLAALFGGIIVGIGIGLVFLGNSSTGGTGIITQILNKLTPIPIGILMGIIDGIIVIIGFIAFDPDSVMYSILALMTITYIVNLMMSGADSSRNVMIISRYHEEIKEYITTVVDRGVTEFPVVGGFTGKEQRMLMTTISRPEIQKLETNILAIDDTAFLIVMPATQVKGRGFSLQKDHKQYNEDILIPM